MVSGFGLEGLRGFQAYLKFQGLGLKGLGFLSYGFMGCKSHMFKLRLQPQTVQVDDN